MIELQEIKAKVKCFAYLHGRCLVLTRTNCYKCPFYKPEHCKDWVRLDIKGTAYLLEPDECEM